MSRWDYDTVFYRVFCITLLVVAFTFTVILTNVFVDIDGLLSDKDKANPPASDELERDNLSEMPRLINMNMLPEDKSEDVYDDKDYQDSNDLYRSKRSLETPDQIFHIKDAKVKKLLTNHLANLLDELDQQDNLNKNSKKNTINENIGKNNDENGMEFRDVGQIKHKCHENPHSDANSNGKEEISIKDYLKDNKEELKINDKEKEKPEKDYKTELLHLAMHNVILEGIIENTNLDDVYKKVADLVKDFENDHEKLNKEELRKLFKNYKSFKKGEFLRDKISSDEHKNVVESLLQRDIVSKRSMKTIEGTENNHEQRTATPKSKDHNVVIKTIIDITAMSNDKTNKDSDSNTKDKINGVIKLIYNGNVIKFKRMDDENNTVNSNKLEFKLNTNTSYLNQNHVSKSRDSKPNVSSQSYYQKVFYDYLKKIKETESPEQEKISSKRLKRHIKIRFDNDNTTVKPKKKKDDDELFVEIETHFDSKGTKGEKKKKLIRDLIAKIQNAIHSDNNALKKKQKHWHVKKRTQNPLTSKSAATLINKLILPFESLARRHIDPIGKAMVPIQELPLVTDVFSHSHWERPNSSPRFFGKSINSAEMNTVDTDYSKVMKHNGIPQRLQKPLNTDMSDEIFQDSNVVDLGNLKFLMKNINGTGFSIGFNQYTDEAPDSETMKLFSGLENIIQTYHQQYDQESTSEPGPQNTYDNAKNDLPEGIDEEQNDYEEHVENDQHLVRRRSIQQPEDNDHHTNNYKIIYGHTILPYKNYNEISNPDKPKISKVKNMKVYRMKSAKKSAFFIDENIFEKDLKPAEILSIADFLQRKKRSIRVKKISNVKIKSKINRYLNTKKMASKSIFMNKKHAKRSKRQVDKIRIIARELPQHGKSEEDNIFVVSDEKLFADRALMREVELPEMEPNDKEHSLEHYDILPPKEEEPYEIVGQSQKVNEDHENQYDVLSPYVYDVNPFETQNEFSRRARHNSLMSKYPHIIMEDTPSYVNHGEEFMIDNNQQEEFNKEATPIPAAPTLIDLPSPSDQDITDLISPPSDHTNYRVSVKIRPKNVTNMSGFKEVHTSINKSYNKNGLTYTSLVNVSQLSKVEKFNKTLSRRGNVEISTPEQRINLKQQHDLIKTLIQQHRHRLDMQLKHLQSEKQKLETLYNENPDNVSESSLDKTNSTSPKTVQIIKADAKKNLTHESTTVETTTQTTTEPTTTVVTTTQYIPTTTVDIMKTKMIETIERNENITNELLKKIDQNTGVLKIFLGKLIATIDVPSKRATELTTKTDDNNKNRPYISNESTTIAASATKQPTVNNRMQNKQMPFNFEDYHFMPNMLFGNLPRPANNSYGIPFVYAVQHPYGIIPNRDNIASMVYHGHIHTNTMTDNNFVKKDKKPSAVKVVLKDKIKVLDDSKNNIDTDFWQPKPGEKVLHDFVVNKNNSRFFLDDNRNDFTVMPLIAQPKGAFPKTIINATKV